MQCLQNFEEASSKEVETFFSSEIANKFSCVDDFEKGRVLVSKLPVEAGAVVWQQPASFSTKPARENKAYDALNKLCEREQCICARPFLWAALCSLTNKQIENSKYVEELSAYTITPEEQSLLLLLRGKCNESPQRWTRMLVELFQLKVSSEILQKLSNRWSTNCFEGSYPHSYIIMWLPSFINHSCLPNLRLSMNESESHTFVALRDISVGEELTLSYIDDMHLQDCISVRKNNFCQNRDFECRCTLCVSSIDPTRRVPCNMDCCGDIYCMGSVDTPNYDAFEHSYHSHFCYRDWNGSSCIICQRMLIEDEMIDIAERENMLWQLIRHNFSINKVREIETVYGNSFPEWLQKSFSCSHFLVERVRAHICDLWQHPSPSPQNSLARKWSISLSTTLQERLDFALLYPLETALQAELMSDFCTALEEEAIPIHRQIEVHNIIQKYRTRAADISSKLRLALPIRREVKDEKQNKYISTINYTIVNECYSQQWIKRIEDVYGKSHIHLQDLRECAYSSEFMVARTNC